MIQYYQDPEAERLSIALWDLARPDRPAKERADRMFNVVTAQDDSLWLVVYEAFPALFKLKDAGNPTGLGRTREQMIQENRLSNPILP